LQAAAAGAYHRVGLESREFIFKGVRYKRCSSQVVAFVWLDIFYICDKEGKDSMEAGCKVTSLIIPDNLQWSRLDLPIRVSSQFHALHILDGVTTQPDMNRLALKSL